MSIEVRFETGVGNESLTHEIGVEDVAVYVDERPGHPGIYVVTELTDILGGASVYYLDDPVAIEQAKAEEGIHQDYFTSDSLLERLLPGAFFEFEHYPSEELAGRLVLRHIIDPTSVPMHTVN